ncbi:hypothetical protein [Sulfurirhabdus autotrophica]|uniref:DUF5640 domain-containing protein n=1 Tax=Sulfurirhabdus autotrophica TaxID=1706046 RepID=A0A4V2W2B8_9PROT|nr:hypothetical protein [Sulfurirhabdus autotrophica]TCV87459.1 hypothetical protein EDC63_105128 [Sulfurirhabdus autotrophica]
MISKLLRCSLLVALIFTFFQALAENNSWLIGNWLHTYDPDGDTQDRLTFAEDGKFTTTEVSSGRKIDGSYLVRTDMVKINLTRQEKIFMKIDLTYDESKSKLYYKSGKSGNTSYYTKMK